MERSPKKEKLFRAASVALGFVLALILMEGTARLFGPKYYQFSNKSSRYFGNSRGYYVPVGEENGQTVYGTPMKGEPPGYRIPDDTPPHSKREQKEWLVLGLGDSFTIGRGVFYRDIYLTRLEEMWKQRGQYAPIKNCAITGADIEKIVRSVPV